MVGYVVLNPVAAGVVADASAWKWSSYKATAGLAATPLFLSLDWMDCVFGGRTCRESQLRYRAFIDGSDEIADLGTAGPVLGAASFESDVRAHIGATLYRIALPRAYRSLAQPSLTELFSGVGFRKGERDLMIQRAHIVHGYRLSEIAMWLNLHPNTASKILRRLRTRYPKVEGSG